MLTPISIRITKKRMYNKKEPICTNRSLACECVCVQLTHIVYTVYRPPSLSRCRNLPSHPPKRDFPISPKNANRIPERSSEWVIRTRAWQVYRATPIALHHTTPHVYTAAAAPSCYFSFFFFSSWERHRTCAPYFILTIIAHYRRVERGRFSLSLSPLLLLYRLCLFFPHTRV